MIGEKKNLLNVMMTEVQLKRRASKEREKRNSNSDLTTVNIGGPTSRSNESIKKKSIPPTPEGNRFDIDVDIVKH